MGLNVAIFEPEADGHHMVLYTRTIIRTLEERGHLVHLVTTERATQHPAYKALLAEDLQFQTHLMPDSPNSADEGDIARLLAQFKRRKNYRRGFLALRKSVSIDSIYMVNIDQADLAIAIKGSPFGKAPFSGMLIGRQFHQGNRLRDRLFRPVFRRLLKLATLRKLLLLDELLVDHVKNWPGASKVVHSPDVGTLAPLGSSVSPRSALGIPNDQFIVLAFGALSLRKGIKEVLDSVVMSPQVSLLLAGVQDTEVQELLKSSGAAQLRAEGRLFEIASFLDDQQESQAFHSADVVWSGYRNWLGMSGVLTLAAIAGKPVVCNNEGLIAHLVQQNRLGVAVDITKPEAVCLAFDTLRHGSQSFLESGRLFAANHTPERFGDCVCDAIESAASMNSSNLE